MAAQMVAVTQKVSEEAAAQPAPKGDQMKNLEKQAHEIALASSASSSSGDKAIKFVRYDPK